MREQEAELMRSFSDSGCLMKFLQTALDDPSPSSCGRCSVCTGVAPGPGTRPPRLDDSPETSPAASMSSSNPCLALRIQPQGLNPRPWRSSRGLRRRPQLDTRASRRSPQASEIPESLLEGAIEALKRWSQTWPERPTWVLAVPGPGAMGEANRKVAQHIAQIGNRPLLEPFEWKGDQSH